MRHNPQRHPDSPCIGVCSTIYDDICRGCGRTVTEVAQWVFLSTEEKEVIWQRLFTQGIAQKVITYQEKIGVRKTS